MNIFVLDSDPYIAAQMQCDKHVVKMVLETGQLLATAHHVVDKELDDVNAFLPKKTHENHPCAIWARTSNNNYTWLHCHFEALLNEYTYRYNKKHKWEIYRETLGWLPEQIQVGYKTPQPLCMPDEYKTKDVIQSYRNYYLGDKARFAKWAKTRQAPNWWKPC
jgi:hypothetical protein